MNNLEKNKNIIETLRTSSDKFKDLQVVDNNLVYQGKSFALDNIDLEAIINGMDDITPENLLQAFTNGQETKDNIKKWEIVKQENPDMKNITIFNNHNLELNKQEEFINIKTSDGKNHLFKNVIGLDIFNEYMQLKAIYGDSISPELLAKNIEKWQLNELEIEPAEKIMENPNVSENIKNQLQEYLTQYKDNTNIEITANVKEDIIYINNKLYPEQSYIITFTKDINNELVAIEHTNNVTSESITKEEINPSKPEMTTNTTENVAPTIQNTVTNNNIDNSNRAANNTDYQNTQSIISDNDFTYIVSKGNFIGADKERVDKYLSNVEEMINIKDPMTEIKIKNIEEAVTNLQLLKDSLSPEELETVQKCNSLCEQFNKSMGLDKNQVLSLKTENRINPEINEEDNSSGYLNIVSIFITVSAILIGLSILAIYIFRK